MEQSPTPKVCRISRDELYARVWQTPLTQLGTEFGISNSGLAQICRRMHVPYPPRGYWAKKAAGKSVTVESLPARLPHVSAEVAIHPTSQPPRLPPAVQAAFAAAATSASAVTVPKGLEGLHSKVEGWLAQHKKQQAERVSENKRNRTLGWNRPLIPDLTARDLYRFRVTSAILKAVEGAGGKVESALFHGKFVFLIGNEKIECSIVEKMMQAFLADKHDASKWTAYPDHHQTGLTSSGFLRATVTTYLAHGVKQQWVETTTKKIASLLPEIVGGIMAAGPIVAEQNRAREEQRRRWEEEEAHRRERRHLKQIDERRWTKFREASALWHEHSELVAFLAEIKHRFNPGSNTVVGNRQLSDWVTWAEQKIDLFDPLRNGPEELFQRTDNSAVGYVGRDLD